MTSRSVRGPEKSDVAVATNGELGDSPVCKRVEPTNGMVPPASQVS